MINSESVVFFCGGAAAGFVLGTIFATVIALRVINKPRNWW